jgi:hypothetical protein
MQIFVLLAIDDPPTPCARDAHGFTRSITPRNVYIDAFIPAVLWPVRAESIHCWRALLSHATRVQHVRPGFQCPKDHLELSANPISVNISIHRAACVGDG